MNEKICVAIKLMLTPVPGWWRVRLFSLGRNQSEKVGAMECDQETHERNLASMNEMMWTYGGMNYWRLNGNLWAARNRTDEERGISRPWTPEEKRQIEREFLILDILIVFLLLLHGIVIWFAFQGA